MPRAPPRRRAAARVAVPEPTAHWLRRVLHQILDIERAEVREQEEKAKGHCRVADTGHNERLARRVSICRILVPETDQEIAAKTNSLPPKVEKQKIVSKDQGEHRAHKQVHVCKETAIALLIGHELG